MKSEIMVSIVCIAYNHEPYIRDCLEGFVKQKTDFKFEVLIHDDASTDKTADIIREYELRYPDIFKPIYQKENQYSQGVKFGKKYIYPKLRGKYVAWCEGDDYWCDENKLQKQFVFMESHPEYAACTHNTLKLNCRNNETTPLIKKNEDCDVTIEEIFKGVQYCFHTSSLFMKSQYKYLPECFEGYNFKDYQRAIYLALNGRIRYMKEVMSVYRFFSAGSWSEKLDNAEGEQQKQHWFDLIHLLTDINEYTNHRYHESIEKSINEYQTNILDIEQKYFTILFSKKYRIYFLYRYDKKTVVYKIMKKLFPQLINKYKEHKK